MRGRSVIRDSMNSEAVIQSSIPAIQADMKFAMVPAATARIPEPGQIGFAAGRERPDTADLNGDRTEIRETAKRVSSDGERVRIELIFDLAQIDEGDEFIQNQARTQQVSDGRGVFPRHAQQPGNRSKNHAKKNLQRGREPGNEAMYPSEDAVYHAR